MSSAHFSRLTNNEVRIMKERAYGRERAGLTSRFCSSLFGNLSCFVAKAAFADFADQQLFSWVASVCPPWKERIFMLLPPCCRASRGMRGGHAVACTRWLGALNCDSKIGRRDTIWQ